jgi:hypothetical protein
MHKIALLGLGLLASAVISSPVSAQRDHPDVILGGGGGFGGGGNAGFPERLPERPLMNSGAGRGVNIIRDPEPRRPGYMDAGGGRPNMNRGTNTAH